MRMLITGDTFAPSLDGPVFLGINTLADMDADSAKRIAQAGRGLFVDAKDDPTRRANAPGAYTANAEQVRAATEAAAAAAKAAKAQAKAEA